MIEPSTGYSYIPTPSYFLGGFDIYDREETLGEELGRFNPNDPIDRKTLVLHYCLVEFSELSYRHKYLLVGCLDKALRDASYDFQALLENDPEEYSSLPSGWDKMDNPRAFFEEVFRLATVEWKDDLQKASLEDQSTW
ncbi:hypothetical protein [Pseudomonas sp. PMCC200344]|uniref:hypothetical protein n=1 Tax=Pseudomonas sp. PMCC200344 TaxID=3042028 RepID=UPI0024B3A436|nr:hypothetical protein [Pseudomonas sp. PMCC200344]